MAVPNLTANSPSSGSIAWSAFSIQYGGVTYGVGAGSTSKRYVWWVYNNGSPILTSGDSVPTNLTGDDLVLFVNKQGIPVNVQASSVVEGSLIVDGSIIGSAVAAGTMHGDRITAGTLMIGQVASLQDSLDEKASEAYVQSRGTDLVTNGTGLLMDNTNFSWATFTSADAPPGASGSFISAKGGRTHVTDELIPVDPGKKYLLSVWNRELSTETDSRSYTGYAPYDAYNNGISPQHYMYREGTTTALAQPLNPGDTTITVESTANWKTTAGSAGHWRNIIFWDYTDPGGKLWEPETYSRNYISNAYPDGGISGNVITLNTPYAGAAKPAGTKLSNGGSGGSYMYSGMANDQATPEWKQYKSAVAVTGIHSPAKGVGVDPASATTSWPAGTAAIKIIFLMNRTVASPYNNPNAQQAWAGISFSDAAAAQATADVQRELAVADMKTLWGHPSNTTLIDGGDIYTNTVLASAMAISDFTNYLSGSDWESTHPWPLGARMTVDTAQAYTGTKSLKIVGTGGATATTGSIVINNITPGEEYYLEFYARRDAAWNGTSSNSKVRVAKQAGAFLFDLNFSAASLTNPDTWYRRAVSYTVPAGTTAFLVTIVSDASAGNVWIDNITLRRRFGGELIVDGAVKTAQLDANAITAKHTLTGPTFQTTATANRGIKIVSSANSDYGSLIAYDASGAANLTINGQDGSIAMKGALTSGSSVTGATVTGGTVQTEATAARGVKMTSTGLVGYNASGVAKFTLTSTGGLTMDAPIVTGGGITGATVTGGTVQSETTAARGVKMTSAGLVGYNTSGVATFNLTAAGALTLTGPVLSGGSVTGGTLQTQVEAARGIKMTTAGLIGYDAAGAAKFTLSTTGGLTVDNPIVSNGEITGAKVTGGTVQSETTAARGVKMTSAGLIGYDTNGVATFNLTAAGALTLAGPVLTGGSLTGGTVQTQVEPELGIKMTTTGLIGYDAEGVAKFTLTTTGGLTLDNPLVSNGSIIGAEVTGGVVQTVDENFRGIKITNNKLVAYPATAVQESDATLIIDGATGNLTMKGMLIAGTNTVAGRIETVAANGSKAILESGSLKMFSNVAGEVSTGGMTAGSWTWNGVNAAQTVLASPRISGSAASEVKLWQGNNGKAGAQIKATDSVKLTVDDTFQVVHAEAPKVHLSAAGGARNTEVRIASNVLALDVDQVWFGNKVVDFANPVNWRWMDYIQPATACPPDGAWRQPYARTWIPWPQGASYAHVTLDVKANTDTATATDSYWQLITWADGPFGATAQTEIAIGYAHNGGGTAILNMGATLTGWMNAPARGHTGQYMHFACNQRVTGGGWVAGRACTMVITFFS